jgi:hypothetical protein
MDLDDIDEDRDEDRGQELMGMLGGEGAMTALRQVPDVGDDGDDGNSDDGDGHAIVWPTGTMWEGVYTVSAFAESDVSD